VYLSGKTCCIALSGVRYYWRRVNRALNFPLGRGGVEEKMGVGGRGRGAIG